MGNIIYLNEQSKFADVNNLINTLYRSAISQGERKKGLYFKILSHVYFKYKFLPCLAGFSSILDFQKTISSARNEIKKKRKKEKNVKRFFNILTPDEFHDRFSTTEPNDFISRDAWKNFFENKRMLELTGHKDDW
ncbi:MAG: hypothetical protein KBD14_01940 [Candidatus Pacebacteria bacterium]|jgi:hypothetical protein|nr:hypothetical protein [Candidatus Paceibacterota bacterium]